MFRLPQSEKVESSILGPLLCRKSSRNKICLKPNHRHRFHSAFSLSSVIWCREKHIQKRELSHFWKKNKSFLRKHPSNGLLMLCRSGSVKDSKLEEDTKILQQELHFHHLCRKCVLLLFELQRDLFTITENI